MLKAVDQPCRVLVNYLPVLSPIPKCDIGGERLIVGRFAASAQLVQLRANSLLSAASEFLQNACMNSTLVVNTGPFAND
jgi:hypothetical protein